MQGSCPSPTVPEDFPVRERHLPCLGQAILLPVQLEGGAAGPMENGKPAAFTWFPGLHYAESALRLPDSPRRSRNRQDEESESPNTNA